MEMIGHDAILYIHCRHHQQPGTTKRVMRFNHIDFLLVAMVLLDEVTQQGVSFEYF